VRLRDAAGWVVGFIWFTRQLGSGWIQQTGTTALPVVLCNARRDSFAGSQVPSAPASFWNLGSFLRYRLY
jgi:hypothetical protein